MSCAVSWMGRLAVVAVIGGCAPSAVDGPPTIRYGETACAQCRMLISEDRFAAAAKTHDGELQTFDGIGCLLRYAAEHPGAVERSWVHDYESARWLDAQDAFVVRSQELTTPMGDGVIAVSTQEQADRLAQALHGRSQRLTELFQSSRDQGRGS